MGFRRRFARLKPPAIPGLRGSFATIALRRRELLKHRHGCSPPPFCHENLNCRAWIPPRKIDLTIPPALADHSSLSPRLSIRTAMPPGWPGCPPPILRSVPVPDISGDKPSVPFHLPSATE